MKLEFSSEKPIYLQIAESIESDIINGVIEEEQQVLSTNEMAAMYRINPATAAKGINELVNQDILYKRRGIGMFVSNGAVEKIKKKKTEAFSNKFIKPLLEEAAGLGITQDDIINMLKEEQGN